MGKKYINTNIDRELVKDVLLSILTPPGDKTKNEIDKVINAATEQLYHSMAITEDLDRKIVIMCFSELTKSIQPEGLEKAYEEVLEKKLEEDKELEANNG